MATQRKTATGNAKQAATDEAEMDHGMLAQFSAPNVFLNPI